MLDDGRDAVSSRTNIKNDGTPLRAVSGKPTLVTGGTGFLGSHLCHRLLQCGAEVHATSRTTQPRREGMRWWNVDLTDTAAVRGLIQKIRPGVIFHLSGLATARPEMNLVIPTFHSLVSSTINLLTAASEFNCRLVLTGSLTEPKASDQEPAPGSPYSAAKWASCGYGRMFHQLYGTPVVIVRPFMTFGPRQQPTKLIPYVTLSLLRQHRPELASGRWEADWIYIEDVVGGLLAAAQMDGIDGRTIDLGSGTLVSVRTVVQHLVDLTCSRIAPRFGALPDRPVEQERAADIESTETLLGWKPATSLIEGLKRTVDWYRQQLRTESA